MAMQKCAPQVKLTQFDTNMFGLILFLMAPHFVERDFVSGFGIADRTLNQNPFPQFSQMH